MKKILFTFMALLLVSSAYALFDTPGEKPQYLVTDGASYSAFYYGANDQVFSGLGMTVHLEFAVYEGDNAASVIDDIEYSGEVTDYVYAYQVFCESPSVDSLTYFGLSREDDMPLGSDGLGIHQLADSSGGIEPSGDGGYFSDDQTEAVWEFEEGELIQGEHSWFLFLFSNSAPVLGNFMLEKSLADDDIPVIPEPATLVLLACGAVLSVSRRK